MRCFLVAIAIFLKIAAAQGAVLFVDHRYLADGSEIDRVFDTASKEIATTLDASQASKKGLDWATHYYKASGARVLTRDFKLIPVPFWIIGISGVIAGSHELFHAIVLANGVVVEPKIFQRNPETAELEQDLKLAPPKSEIHGDLEIGFATGKGPHWEGRGRP
jgi:hypothetical protein